MKNTIVLCLLLSSLAVHAQRYPLPYKATTQDYLKAWYFDDLFEEVQQLNAKMWAVEKRQTAGDALVTVPEYMPLRVFRSIIYADPIKVEPALKAAGWQIADRKEGKVFYFYPETGLQDWHTAKSQIMLEEADTIVNNKTYRVYRSGFYSSANETVAYAYLKAIPQLEYTKISEEEGDGLTMAFYRKADEVLTRMILERNGLRMHSWYIAR